MDDVESVLHRLGRAFVAGLVTPGYELISASRSGHTGQTYTMAGAPALLGRWPGTERDEAMSALSTVAGRGVTVEMIGDLDGNYTIHWSRELPSLPARIVLDQGYRFPGHERPAPRQPGAPDRRPTDPAVLAEVEQLVAAFVARHHPGGYRPGHREDEILAAEARLGVRLPEDLRALYRTVHDDDRESGLLDPFRLVSLDRLLEWNADSYPGYDDGLFATNPVIFDCHPAGHVRRVSSSSGWLTFAADYGMNFGAVDLDPGPGGVAGQILTHGRDVWAPVNYVAPSIRHLLRRAVDFLDESHPEQPEHTWSAGIGGGDLAALAAAVPDPEIVQQAWLREADEVRFTDLARFGALRSVRVADGRRTASLVDMRAAPGQPLEHVDVEADRFVPAGLPRTVRYLRLAGNTEPVSVAGLAELPELLRLDLADATVADVEAIATLPAVRVLILDGPQWTALLATGWRPDTLAAVSLGDRAGVADTTGWSRAFGGTAVHHTVRGRR